MPTEDAEKTTMMTPQPEDKAAENPDAVAPAPKSTDDDLVQLEELELTLYSLRYAMGEISGLGPIIDPAQATQSRGIALSELQSILIKTLTNPDVSDLLSRLSERSSELSPLRADQIKILVRDRDDVLNVPPELNAKYSRLTTEAEDVWRHTKPKSDWKSFEGYLDRLVACALEIAKAKDPEKDPYDVWLNEFEHGSSAEFYDAMFTEIKACVVPLLKACIQSSYVPDMRCVSGAFDVERQWMLAEDLLEIEGLNKDALWVGRTEHPFTAGSSRNFVIVAGHAYKDNLLSNVYSILHEGGHALYEQNIDKTLEFTSLSGGTSMGMHESQSRFYENLIGRSEAFSKTLFECIRSRFPGQFSRVTPRQLYRAANSVTPGLIRTEADELTYPLHIMVRYEIERMLFAGEIKAKDVPGIWAEKYQTYLGLKVSDHAHGALQDTHWSGGSFGYFPAYAYGSAIASQLKAAMIQSGVNFESSVARGNLSAISNWLKNKIWKYGRRKDSPELIKEACGEDFSVHYYTDYLTEKFSGLYGLA